MSELKNGVYKSRTIKTIYLSFGFLLLIILLTLGLHFYNSKIESNISSLESEIKTFETSINEINKDKLVQINNLYSLNKNIFDRLEKYSQISSFIDHVNFIEKKYNIKLGGFNYSNGELKTSVVSVSSNDTGIDYEKTVKFIKGYRESEDSIFDLGFISKVVAHTSTTNGFDKQLFEITLKIKDEVKKAVKQIEK